MNTYIALFRGINVGGKNILPMKELRVLLEDLGCKNVRTYIQSGNVVFDGKKKQTDKLPKKISNEILKNYGFEPNVLLLAQSELQNAVANNPFPTDDGRKLHVFFLYDRPTKPDIEKLNSIKIKTEQFKLHERVFYFYAPDGIGRSKIASNVERCLGVSATGRNWNTVGKLMSMIKA